MRRLRWWLLALCTLALASTAFLRGAESAAVDAAEALRLNNLGVAAMNQQRLDHALDLFQQAAKLDPELYPAQLNQGIALYNLQRLEQARPLLLEATQQHPQDPRGWYNLGLLDKAAGQPEPALDAFDHVTALVPDDADAHYFRATLLAGLGRTDDAIAAFERALALNPFHVSAEFGLARAYQRAGQDAEARRHLQRFQQLTQEKLGAPMSLVYGDQGKLSLAEQVVPPAGPVPAAIPVHFVPATAAAGLTFVDAGGKSLAGFLGSGACFFDYDSDGRPDLLLLNSGADAVSALYHNEGDGHFTDVTQKARLEIRGPALGCAAGDYDHDGHPDVAITAPGRLQLYHNQNDGTFREASAETGVSAGGLPLGVTFIDYDHDGDLDLYVSRFVNLPAGAPAEPFAFPFEFTPTSNLLWRNNGNGTFTDVTAETGLAGSAPGVAAAGTDVNNDRAIDLVLTGWSAAPAVLTNPREGKFRALANWNAPVPAPTAGVAVLDFDKDGWMDLAFTHWGRPGLTLWRNQEGRGFERVALPDFGWTRGWGLAALDFDNDGWIDLVAVGETDKGAEIRLLRNRGPAGFEDRTAAAGLADLPLANPRALVTADVDGDGDTDLLITQNGGAPLLLRNDGGNRNGWVRVALRGQADNRSAIGTEVEVYAGTNWQKWEIAGASGYLGQSALALTAGLGDARQADILRMRWPTGIVQDEVELAANQAHAVEEIDRRGSSCPLLFVWNGERYELVSDIIGAAIVGHWVGPGQRNIPDPDEYVKVAGTRVQPADGKLRFRLLEPMEEVNYLDQVRLLAVDHPADVDVYPNERFLSAPPFPAFQVLQAHRAQPPRGAWDDAGRDVLPALLERDRHYVTGFKLLPFAGFAASHGLTLDLGPVDTSKPLRLILSGFIEYFTANSMYAAHQAGLEPVSPYVEAEDASGHWVRVVDDMGFPAGLPRTIVADLTGKLPVGTERIRIVTNLQIYWDQILVDTAGDQAPVRVTEVPLAGADLDFHGFPRATERQPRGDVAYDYADVSQTGPYSRFIGHYTRYGDVRGLVSAVDDRFAIFGPGEEVALEFNPGGLPALPAGWARDYFFYADGFVKDMDFYEADALTVGPLPFHGMGIYPYGADKNYPESDPYLRYLFDDNTRAMSGTEGTSFRFHYPPPGTRR